MNGVFENARNSLINFRRLTGTSEVRENLDVELFDEGLLDSMGTVQLLVELDGQLGVNIPVSEFERDEWSSPNKIIAKVAELQG